MGQSLTKIYIHLIFSTKNRFPFIKYDFEERMHEYMAGILKNFDSSPIIINSTPDHVHLLFCMSKNYALSKIVEELKKNTSKWLKEIDPLLTKFSWQTGYAAFSVSSSKIHVVKNYINKQKEHHRQKSFREEVEEFFKEYAVIEYNPLYFWEE